MSKCNGWVTKVSRLVLVQGLRPESQEEHECPGSWGRTKAHVVIPVPQPLSMTVTLVPWRPSMVRQWFLIHVRIWDTLWVCYQAQEETQTTDHSYTFPWDSAHVSRDLRAYTSHRMVYLRTRGEICRWSSLFLVSGKLLRSNSLVIVGPFLGHLYS